MNVCAYVDLEVAVSSWCVGIGGCEIAAKTSVWWYK